MRPRHNRQRSKPGKGHSYRPMVNANSRSFKAGGRVVIPDDERMADHTFHPTKGYKKISAKRSRASMVIQRMAAGEPYAFRLGGGAVQHFIAEGY
jgi:hypothetical protein